MNKSSVLKIKESVDIYEIPMDNGKIQLQFYKINTREKATLEVDSYVGKILATLDGVLSIHEVFQKLQLMYSETEASDLFSYLVDQGFLTYQTENIHQGSALVERYSRQINYFDDLLLNQSGIEAQLTLSEKEVVILGVGSVGSAIAIHLVRAGVKKLTLVDYKTVSKRSIQRHLYVSLSSFGKLKTHVLKEYLLRIDPECQIRCITEKFNPKSNVWDIVSESTNVVVNSADEPYIGHTTLKLGRSLWPAKIALYVAGGFDAHNMSTGEFIIPNVTPCADCCSNTFKKALNNWKPTYPEPSIMPAAAGVGTSYVSVNIGGAGGVAAQSLFSASYGAINIINYLLGNIRGQDKFSRRGEYIINRGLMTWVDLKTQGECNVCGF